MADDVKKQIVATVIGSLIVAVIVGGFGLVQGWLPRLWNGIAAAGTTSWAFVTQPISVSLWILVLAAGLALGLSIVCWRAGLAHATAPQSDPTSIEQLLAAVQLSDLESAIVRQIIDADGRWVDLEELKHCLRQPHLILTDAIESLRRKHVVARNESSIHYEVVVTRLGAELAKRNGWLRQNPIR